MTYKDKFKIVFFGSSSFVVPILHGIYDSKGKTLKDVLKTQLKWLKENKNDFLEVFPEILILDSIDFEEPKLKAEINKEIQLLFVSTQPDNFNHTKKISNPVNMFCEENSVEVFSPEKINKEKDEFKKLAESADISIVASFGQIISQEILDVPKYGFINWHPSDLPKYRGATPMQTALKNGDSKTALSWIKMSKEMDAGDILLKLKTRVLDSDNFDILAQKLATFGQNTWGIAVVLKILSLQNQARYSLLQDSDDATFCSILKKSDKLLSNLEKNAFEIYNQYRAYMSFPGTAFIDEYFKSEVKILDCEPYKKEITSDVIFENENWVQTKEGKQNKTLLKCKDASYLEIKEIVLASGKKINFSGFVFKF